MKVTVDASVAVKWFVPENHHDQARHLLGPRIERHAPGLLLAETANAIWRKARRGEIQSAARFVDGIAKLPGIVRLKPSEHLLRDALTTALRIGHPVYDSLYIACARLTGSILVTADRRLAKVTSGRARQVAVITLGDRARMAKVEAAAFRLVISRAKVVELIEAWNRFAATEKSVLADLYSASREGLSLVGPEASRLATTSPTYRGLARMVEELSTDERVDLLVLGWMGRGHTESRKELFDLAMRQANDRHVVHYITGMGAHWRAGLEAEAGAD